MSENRRRGKGILIFLVFVVLVMAVGFASFTQQLNIAGNVIVSASQWSVHYVNNSITPTTGSVTASAASINDTDFTFTVTLAKPGDFYEATIQVTNDGNFNAVLKSITMSTLTAAQAKYLTYTVTYDGHEYDASASNLTYALATNATKSVVVRVEYILPEDAEDLPQQQTTVSVSGNLYYEKAT